LPSNNNAAEHMVESPIELRALRILIIDDEENIRFALTMCLESDGHKIVSVGTIDDALEQTAREAFDLIFLDVRLGTQYGLDYIKPLLEENPWARIVVITAFASIETAVEAMKRGATDYLPKPFEPAQLLLLTRKVAERRLLERKVEALQKTLGEMDVEADLPTSSPVLRQSIEFAHRIATANAPVLIRGERGTGRGRLARAIHAWSWRAHGPFATVTFDGRSADAIEAELFGADRGDNIGAIAFCQGGTLLLDEIGGLPLRLQPRLVTLLRDKEYERQDQSARHTVDVRIVATTSDDLSAAVASGNFREDLLMALSITQLDLPPLRQRSEDILPLADRYLAFFSREHHRPIVGISRDASFVIKNHAWTGNVRELRNVIERAVLLCEGDTITLDHLPADLLNTGARDNAEPRVGYRIGDLVPLEIIEEAHIRQVLASAKTLRRAAAILGVNASALCRKLKRLEVEAQNDQPA
jgi:two-component system, NtrC family, response regulator AlgB